MEEQLFSSDTNLYYDDSFFLAQEELEVTTSNCNDSSEYSNNSTSSPHSNGNFSESNSWSHPDYFDFNLPNEESENVSLDDCLIDIGFSTLDESATDIFIADLLSDIPADQSNGYVEYQCNQNVPEIVDLNSNEICQISDSSQLTANRNELVFNGDFSIEMDDDDDDDISSYDYSLSPDNDSSNSKRNTLVSRPARKSRNKCRTLPYTVYDLPPSQSLHNKDIAEGKPGEPLILTKEEIQFFKQEGLGVPTHLPLTKEELRTLKTVRRKIRNKISAKNSRAKKQDYVSGLEKRVTICNEENIKLKKKMKILEDDNKSLLGQVRHLRDLLTQYAPQPRLGDSSKPSLCLCMLTFLMLFLPYLMPNMVPIPTHEGSSFSAVAPSPGSRRLLQESDLSMELGNPYDVTVRASPAWKYPPQSPVLSPHSSNNALSVKDTPSNDDHVQQSSVSSDGEFSSSLMNTTIDISNEYKEQALTVNDSATWQSNYAKEF